jgi:hypothetical protein
MAKLNPYTLSLSEPRSETKSFTDPAQPGTELTLTLAPPQDTTVFLAIDEQAEANAETYIGHPEKLVPYRGRLPRVTRELCRVIAILQVMEEPPGGEPRYDFGSWAMLFVTMGSAMADVVAWATRLLQEGQTDSGNASAARGEGSSVPPKPTTRSTRKSRSAGTPSR